MDNIKARNLISLFIRHCKIVQFMQFIMAVSVSYVYCFSLYAFCMNNIMCVNYTLQNCLVYTIYNGCISVLSLSTPTPTHTHTHKHNTHTDTQTHTHTHTHTHIHLNNIWPLMSQHNNIWSHQNLNFYDTPFSQHLSLQKRPTPHPFIFFSHQMPALGYGDIR